MTQRRLAHIHTLLTYPGWLAMRACRCRRSPGQVGAVRGTEHYSKEESRLRRLPADRVRRAETQVSGPDFRGRGLASGAGKAESGRIKGCLRTVRAVGGAGLRIGRVATLRW